jgi:hemerythrin superfamily protein
MAKAKTRTRNAAKRTRSQGTARNSQDAIALLKADHRQVEDWFEQFESSRSDDKKKTLATRICQALRVHTTIEEEIFYPAFLEATEDKDMHHEAEVEHNGAKKLIAEIEASGPEDDYYDAKVKVLSEMIKHHVKEEEQRDGMFAEAKKSDMDLQALGEQLAARKAELMATAGDEDEVSPVRRGGANSSRGSGVVARLAKRVRGE